MDGVVRFAFRICNNGGLATFHNGKTGVGGPEIDSNDFRHKV
jgi:hypothetical protein